MDFQQLSPSQGVIEGIKERKNFLIRPSVANIDQLILVFAAQNPDPDFLLMDRLTVIAEKNNLEVIICVTKIDIDTKGNLEYISKRFINTGYKIIGITNKVLGGTDPLKSVLKGKISTLSGPSGAGKSTLINNLNPELNLTVGAISTKTKRGKHTTTYCELLEVMESSYLVDTPGFTSLELKDMGITQLRDFFIEFKEFKNCHFASCIHDKENSCGIKQAVEEGKISKERYENYLLLLNEIRENEVRY